MSKKLKAIYAFLFCFSILSLVAFQNCSQGTSDFGNFTGSSENGGNGAQACNNSTKTLLLEQLLADPNFKYIITDQCGNVVDSGVDRVSPLILSATGRYRFYVVGVESVPGATSLPAVNKWVGCAILPNTTETLENNLCLRTLPTTVLNNDTAGCATADPNSSQQGEAGEKGFRPINCDTKWTVGSEYGRPILVNYDWFRGPQGQVWIPSGITAINYIKANAPSTSYVLRLVVTTTP